MVQIYSSTKRSRTSFVALAGLKQFCWPGQFCWPVGLSPTGEKVCKCDIFCACTVLAKTVGPKKFCTAYLHTLAKVTVDL